MTRDEFIDKMLDLLEEYDKPDPAPLMDRNRLGQMQHIVLMQMHPPYREKMQARAREAELLR